MVTQSPMAVVETKWMIVDVTDWNRIVSVTGRLLIAAKKLVANANDRYMNLFIQTWSCLSEETFDHPSTDNKTTFYTSCQQNKIDYMFTWFLHWLIAIAYSNWEYILWQIIIIKLFTFNFLCKINKFRLLSKTYRSRLI